MSLTTTITRSKPFYVAAGATDLAVKTLRSGPPSRPPVARGRQAPRHWRRPSLPSASRQSTLPVARAGPTAVVGVAVEVTDRTDAVYGDLLTRGRKVVGRIRRQKSTQDLKRDAGTTVRRTKAAKTTERVRRFQAAKGTTTAKKSAKRRPARPPPEDGGQAHDHHGPKRATATRTAAKGGQHLGPQDRQVPAARATKAGAAKVGS